MTDRGSCWSITIFDDAYKDASLPAKWTLQGQMEKCPKTGTDHFQGMLTTPQIRFSAVKRVFPKSHIELAKNKIGLVKYVKKEDTRIQSIPDRSSDIPTLWDYSESLAMAYNEDEFIEFKKKYSDKEFSKMSTNDMLLEYIDTLVMLDIKRGERGVEFIAVNPMFRSAWKRFGMSMVFRAQLKPIQDSPTGSAIHEINFCEQSIDHAATQSKTTEETESVQQDIPWEENPN